MPVSPSYPGVYVEEIPSGNFTVTGVATSITAFVGRAAMGPTNDPQICFSFGEFQNAFGGRGFDYPMSYAVEDFFLNGGGEAIIVRVEAAQPPSLDDVVTDVASIVSKAATAKSDADKAVTDTATALTAAKTADAGGSTPTTKAAVDAAQTASDNAVKAQTAAAAAVASAAAYKTAVDAAQTAQNKATASNAPADVAAAATALQATYAAGVKAGSAVTPEKVVAGAAPATLDVGGFKFQAASNGAWGNHLSLAIDTTGINDVVAARYGSTATKCFNLTLTYTKPDKSVVTERYTALTIDNTPYRVDRVLQQQSNLAIMPVFPANQQKPPTLASTTAFANGVDGGYLSDTDLIGDPGSRTGLYALEHTDLFNLLCIPWDQRGTDTDTSVHTAASAYCVQRRAMYIVDSLASWAGAAKKGAFDKILPTDLGITTQDSQRNSIAYFPKIKKPDLEMGGQIDVFPACGIIAGQIATTDAARGVWKAPAGIAVGLGGVTDLEFNLTDAQQGVLNPVGVNCLRNFRVLGPLIWGARTLRGADLMSDDYKYVSVRRLTLYIEESLYRGTKFAVFEPNDETLWSQMRLAVGTFMADLARQGAFYSYSVTCDKTTTTQSDIDRGVCNVRVAFAPVKPAEFIILQIQQQAGTATA